MKKTTYYSSFFKGNRGILILSLFTLLSFTAHSQVFWTENFGTDVGCNNQGQGAAGTWTVANGAWTVTLGPSNDPNNSNLWFVSATEAGMGVGNCGDGCLNTPALSNQTLHIGANDNFFYDNGASYDAGGLCGILFCVTTDARAESPTINCSGQNTIALNFNYIEEGDPGNDYCYVEYSIDNGVTWLTLLNPIPPSNNASCNPQGKWTASGAIALPATCNNNPNVKIGFHWLNNDDGIGTDPSVAIDDVTLSTPPSANIINTGTVTGPICACSIIIVPFTSVGTFNAGNTYTAQLSDAAGSFAAPISIGNVISTANAGTINCTVPCNTPAGSGYLVQVVSSSPVASNIFNNGVPIQIVAQPVATFSYIPNTYCTSAGGTATPTFSGGGTAGTFTAAPAGLIINAATGAVTVGTSATGNYTVTNTIPASNGCLAATATSVIHIITSQNATFNYALSTYCVGGPNPTPTITGVAGGSFTSSPAGLVFNNNLTGQINLSTSTTGTYSIKYTTPGPCAASDSVSITITTAPSATFSYAGSPYCSNAANPSPTFPVGSSAGTFTAAPAGLLINAVTGLITITGSTANTYTITNNIAASASCPSATATATVQIIAVQNAAFTYSSNTFCQAAANPNPTITGVAGGTFSATPAGLAFVSTTTGQINLAGTTLNTPYTIKYVTPGPCPDSATFTVTVISPPVASFNYPITPICQNAANPFPTFTGGGVAGTFTSTAGLVFISSTTGQVNLMGSTAGGPYTVTNTIAAANGCAATSATSTITITAVPVASFSYAGSPYCKTAANPNPTLGVGAVAGAGTFTATPAGLVFISPTTGQVDLTNSAAGIYTVTQTIPAAAGCPIETAFSTITITAPPVADFSYPSLSYCSNLSNPSPILVGIAGTFTAAPGGLMINSGTGVVTLSSSTAGLYTVTNTIPATGGCASTTATTSITIVAAPNASVNSPTICLGRTATLTATLIAGATYQWLGGAVSAGIDSAHATPTVTTTYSVIVTANTCADTVISTVTIVNCNLRPGFIVDDTSLCLSGCVNFTDTTTGNPTNWDWLFPGGTPSSANIQGPVNVCYDAPGDYTVILNVSNSNEDTIVTRTAYIHVWGSTPVTITPQNLILNGCETGELTAHPTPEAGATYLWGPEVNLQCDNCQTALVNPTATQQYWVNCKDIHNCYSADTVTVEVQNIFTYFMPTGFSPNADGINDILLVRGRGVDYIILKIFDRIGEEVFHSSDLNSGWDGTYHGLPLNDGVFTYTLDITFCNGEKKSAKGNVTLVR